MNGLQNIPSMKNTINIVNLWSEIISLFISSDFKSLDLLFVIFYIHNNIEHTITLQNAGKKMT